MKKLVLLIVILAVAGLLAYKFLTPKKEQHQENNDHPLAIGKNSSTFNTAFGGMLDEYYAMQSALVDWDTVKVDQAAYNLSLKADSLPLSQLKADSDVVKTARSLAVSVSSEAKGLVGEGNIEQKRRAFNMLTDELYTLIRTVRYDGEIIYHIRCPMAFKDSEEGFWLSKNDQVINPYLGKSHPVYKAKMLGCGEISDSLDFTKTKK
jgi:hypothetical protein